MNHVLVAFESEGASKLVCEMLAAASVPVRAVCRTGAEVIVSRTGVKKPPVQLGVGKKGLEKKTSYAILKVVWQPQKVSKEGSS